MKQILYSLALVCIIQQSAIAQTGMLGIRTGKPSEKIAYGIRAGANISHITHESALRINSKLGFVAGVFADLSFDKSYGWRDEISYVYAPFQISYKNSKTNLRLQYINFSHAFAFNIGSVFQVHAGPQLSFLTKAVADTMRHVTAANASKAFSVSKQTNLFAPGGLIGFEIHYKDFLLGGRYNLSFVPVNRNSKSNSYSRQDYSVYSNQGNYRWKNQMIQITAGVRFNTHR